MVLSLQNVPEAHVLMPAFNAELLIKQSIESVLKQTHSNIKLVIIDDGSTDHTFVILQDFLNHNSHLKDIIHLSHNELNYGVAYTRKALLNQSKAINSNAYIFWLDSDDIYIEDDFIHTVVTQMVQTNADICLINFSIIYENEQQFANAVGLLRDQEQSKGILEQIYNAPQHVVSPLDVAILNITSLGCIKCYSPRVHFPETVANTAFSDFVYMASLLFVDLITALDPKRTPLQYLRRSTSICGRRTAESFLIHVPTQLDNFLNAVVLNVKNDGFKKQKLKAAKDFVIYKLKQYRRTLEKFVSEQTIEQINQETLSSYNRMSQDFLAKVDAVIKLNNID